MVIEVKNGNVIVSSTDYRAKQEVAEIFAKILSKNWLEGCSQMEPLLITADERGSGVVYMARTVSVN